MISKPVIFLAVFIFSVIALQWGWEFIKLGWRAFLDFLANPNNQY